MVTAAFIVMMEVILHYGDVINRNDDVTMLIFPGDIVEKVTAADNG